MWVPGQPTSPCQASNIQSGEPLVLAQSSAEIFAARFFSWHGRHSTVMCHCGRQQRLGIAVLCTVIQIADMDLLRVHAGSTAGAAGGGGGGHVALLQPPGGHAGRQPRAAAAGVLLCRDVLCGGLC